MELTLINAVISSVDKYDVAEDKLYKTDEKGHAINGVVVVKLQDGRKVLIRPINRTGDSRNLDVKVLEVGDKLEDYIGKDIGYVGL